MKANLIAILSGPVHSHTPTSHVPRTPIIPCPTAAGGLSRDLSGRGRLMCANLWIWLLWVVSVWLVCFVGFFMDLGCMVVFLLGYLNVWLFHYSTNVALNVVLLHTLSY